MCVESHGRNELANSQVSRETKRHDHEATSRSPGSTLIEAASHLRRSLCADGSDAGGFGTSVDDDDFDRPEREWKTLREWAEERGLIVPPHFPAPDRVGGREHDVRFDPGSRTWWKYTKPNLAGFTVEQPLGGRPYPLNAMPLQYLGRLIMQNEVFQDSIEFKGLWLDQAGWRIVTTQPHIKGRPATLDEITTGMMAMGFELLPWRGIGYENSLAFQMADIFVWDVHPANMVVTGDGTLVPIDVILTQR